MADITDSEYLKFGIDEASDVVVLTDQAMIVGGLSNPDPSQYSINDLEKMKFTPSGKVRIAIFPY